VEKKEKGKQNPLSVLENEKKDRITGGADGKRTRARRWFVRARTKKKEKKPKKGEL